MIASIIRTSVQNKPLVGLFTLLLIAWGVWSFTQLTIDAVPDITNNQVQVVTISPSLAPQEVEQFITYPVEMAMANLQDVSEIRSVSRYGLSVVTIVFKDDVPILKARQLVSEGLATVEVPPAMGQPSLMPITTGLGEIYQYTLEVKPGYEHLFSYTDLRTIQDWVIKRRLAGIPGIVEISSFGGFLRQYEVAVNPERLLTYDLTIEEVHAALMANNENTGGSYIQQGPYAYYIRTEGLLQNDEAIGKVVVAVRNGTPVLVRDIAQVREGHAPRYGAMTKDGKGEVVGGITLMLKGGNAYRVIEDVRERIDQIRKNLPEGLELNVYLDRASLVNRVMITVRNNLLEGGLIVIFVLILLLGNLRAGLIVASIIPLSMLFAIGMMRLTGQSANLMSLGAIDFGLVVDGAVIIVEGVLHRLHAGRNLHSARLNQQQMDEQVIISATSIMKAAVFGMLIILIVYLPIMSLVGIEGKMFRPMALTVSYAIIGAMILSLTYVPAVSAWGLSSKHSGPTWSDRLMHKLESAYLPILKSTLARPKTVLAVILLIFSFSLWLFSRMGAEFIPSLEEGDLAMQTSIPPGSSLNESIKIATKAEKILLENFPEVLHVVSKIGTAEVPTDPMAIEEADVMITLRPKGEWVSAQTKDELAEKMKESLSVIRGAQFNFTQPIQLRFNELMTGVKSDIAIKIFGEDLDTLLQKAEQVAAIAKGVQGAADVKVQQADGLPQLMVRYDREQLARYGLSVSSLNTTVRAAFAGEKAGFVYEGERRFDLVVRLKEEMRDQPETLSRLYTRTVQGGQLPLAQVASIELEEGPMQILRERTHRLITVGINVRNRDVQSLVEELHARIDQQVHFPPGYYLTFGGQFENLQAAKDRLLVAVPIALLLIFMLLYFTFRSIANALIIFTAIPLSAVGGILALWLRDMPFSISAGVGFIALFGVAVLNGIVLVSYFNQLRAEGITDVSRRVVEGASARLRPVLMTAAVASLGFLPMALSTTAGGEVQRPLATVVIGGLISATLLTLLVVPLIYHEVEKRKAHALSAQTASNATEQL